MTAGSGLVDNPNAVVWLALNGTAKPAYNTANLTFRAIASGSFLPFNLPPLASLVPNNTITLIVALTNGPFAGPLTLLMNVVTSLQSSCSASVSPSSLTFAASNPTSQPFQTVNLTLNACPSSQAVSLRATVSGGSAAYWSLCPSLSFNVLSSGSIAWLVPPPSTIDPGQAVALSLKISRAPVIAPVVLTAVHLSLRFLSFSLVCC